MTPASSITENIAEKGGEKLVEGAGLILSEKDRIQQLLQEHHATKKNRELQELLLQPIPKLTQAFQPKFTTKKKSCGVNF